MENKNIEVAILLTQFAANWAWNNHPGMFVDKRLEDILDSIGNKIYPLTRSPETKDSKDVLHVLTEAYDIGGHTRLACQWIIRDSRRSDVVITQQRSSETPTRIIKAINQSGGKLINLADNNDSILSRIHFLNSLASNYKFIILHIHPYDIIPILALINLDKKVILVNHADHVFWIGSSVANTVVQFRASGYALSIERRGLSHNQQYILPIPLNTNKNIKYSNGKTKDKVTALSIASEYKYGYDKPNVYINTLLKLIDSNDSLEIIIVGPRNKGTWAEAARISNGRIKPMGVQKDVAIFYEKADIYLDSFPFASLTSLLDAALYNLPVISLNDLGKTNVFSSDDPDLPNEIISVSSVESFIERVQYFIRYPKEAESIGRNLRRLLEHGREDKNWSTKLEELYLLTEYRPRISLGNVKKELDKNDFKLIDLQKRNSVLAFDRIWLNSSKEMILSERFRYFILFFLRGWIKTPIPLLSNEQIQLLKNRIRYLNDLRRKI